MCGTTARVTLNVPPTFVSSTTRMSTSSRRPRRLSRIRPALFTKTSMRPQRSAIRSTAAAQAAESRMSTCSAVTRAPAAATTSAAAAALSRKRKLTFAPSAASNSTIARPIPRLTPVTITALSASPESLRIGSASTRDGESAVDHERMAGDHAGLRETEKIDRARDVLRSEDRPCRRALGESREHLLAVGEVLQGVRIDNPRAHRVHSDPPRTELLGERPHQRLERRLGSADEAIGGDRSLSPEAGHRDDPATRRHERQGALREQIQRERVRFHAPPPVLQRHLHRGPEDAARGVAHHDVEPVEVLSELGKQLVHALGLPDSRLDRAGAAPHAADLGAERLSLLVAVVVVHGDVATRGGELPRDGPANSPRGAGDERDLSGEGF